LLPCSLLNPSTDHSGVPCTAAVSWLVCSVRWSVAYGVVNRHWIHCRCRMVCLVQRLILGVGFVLGSVYTPWLETKSLPCCLCYGNVCGRLYIYWKHVRSAALAGLTDSWGQGPTDRAVKTLPVGWPNMLVWSLHTLPASSSGFYPPKSEVEIVGNFLFPHFWAQVNPSIFELKFPNRPFLIFFPLSRGKFCLKCRVKNRRK